MIIPNWSAPSNIKACTICANDNINNLKIIDNIPKNIIWLNQVHGNKVLSEANQHTNYFITTNTTDLLTNLKNHYNNQLSQTYLNNLNKADAIALSDKNIVCAIKTADCLPIFLTNIEGSWIAAVHAGWRGLAANIIENTIKHYNNQKDLKNLIAWIGPGICKEHFIVDKDVKDIFVNNKKSYGDFFIKNNNKYSANLLELAIYKLQNLNIHNIYHNNYCTYCNKDLFFSYRRDGKNTGRLLNLLWIG